MFEPKQGTHASLITGCNFNGLEFLEFQNKSISSSNIFHYQIYALSKMEIKNYDSFFKSALLLSGDIQLNSVPTSDTSFVCKRTLNKRSFCCTKCDLRAHKNAITRSFLIAIYVVTAQDGRIYLSIMFLFVLAKVGIQNPLC